MLNEKQLRDIGEDFVKFSDRFNEHFWHQLRPWQEFFGTFKLPQRDMKNIEQRLSTNWLHYRSNYICICAVITMLQIIFAPVVFLVLVICIGVCMYFLLIRKKPIEVGNVEIDDKMKLYGCSGFSFLVMALSGVMVKLLWVAIYGVVLCSVHMLLRPRSVSSKTDKLYEDMKSTGSTMWLDPENPSAQGGDGNDSTATRRKVGAANTTPGFMPFTVPSTGKKD
jgi:hypothetical protein